MNAAHCRKRKLRKIAYKYGWDDANRGNERNIVYRIVMAQNGEAATGITPQDEIDAYDYGYDMFQTGFARDYYKGGNFK